MRIPVRKHPSPIYNPRYGPGRKPSEVSHTSNEKGHSRKSGLDRVSCCVTTEGVGLDPTWAFTQPRFSRPIGAFPLDAHDSGRVCLDWASGSVLSSVVPRNPSRPNRIAPLGAFSTTTSCSLPCGVGTRSETTNRDLWVPGDPKKVGGCRTEALIEVDHLGAAPTQGYRKARSSPSPPEPWNATGVPWRVGPSRLNVPPLDSARFAAASWGAGALTPPPVDREDRRECDILHTAPLP